eukprot:scaffold145213_cov31-Tisochrysis_lutea.AAC.6
MSEEPRTFFTLTKRVRLRVWGGGSTSSKKREPSPSNSNESRVFSANGSGSGISRAAPAASATEHISSRAGGSQTIERYCSAARRTASSYNTLSRNIEPVPSPLLVGRCAPSTAWPGPPFELTTDPRLYKTAFRNHCGGGTVTPNALRLRLANNKRARGLNCELSDAFKPPK